MDKLTPIQTKAPLVFTLQWHLTACCEQKCKHCYMREEPTYLSELKNELDINACFKIVDDFVESFGPFCQKLRINFTGGDPLLKEGIFDLINYASKRGIRIGILGNPNLITPKIARKLKRVGVATYQVSLDGLAKTHDALRGKGGLFNQTLNALSILKKEGITTVVMFTLSKRNKKELIPLIKLLNKSKLVDIFDFARLVPCGSGRKLMKDLLSPKEFRNLLLEVFYAYLDFAKDGGSIYFGRKDSLWALLYHQLGLANFIKTKPSTFALRCLACHFVKQKNY